jgi:hypothetical protein
MSDVKAWPLPTGRPAELPRRIHRPCDSGLLLTVMDLESQLGTIEAYNRLVEAASRLKEQIDAGKAKPQNPLFAVSIRGG